MLLEVSEYGIVPVCLDIYTYYVVINYWWTVKSTKCDIQNPHQINWMKIYISRKEPEFPFKPFGTDGKTLNVTSAFCLCKKTAFCTDLLGQIREGCTKQKPEKVWSFAKPPSDPPRFGIFMKNIKFQCVFWPFLGHFWPFLRPQNRPIWLVGYQSNCKEHTKLNDGRTDGWVTEPPHH